MKFLIIISCIALSRAQFFGKTLLQKQVVSENESQPEPISPYSFSYIADAVDGSSARQESADALGVVRGSYSLSSADGIKRIVNYIADHNGFRAQVQTNEPGTESKSPADVDLQSSQLPAEEIALRVGPRPVEVKPQIQAFGIKTVEQKLDAPVLNFRVLSKPFVLSRPAVDQTFLQQRVLSEIPIQKKIESTFVPIVSSFQLTPKQIEIPIKLLSKVPKIHTLITEGEIQKKEELVAQNFEGF